MRAMCLLGMALGLGLACVSPAFGATWFESGIPGYSVWPSDGSDHVVPGVGTWHGTEGAELLGEAGAKRLSFGTTESHPLEFVPLAPASAETGELAVAFDIQFTSGSEAPPVDPEMKGAVTVLQQGDDLVFAGLVKAAAGTTNVWTTLTGAVPDITRESRITICLRTVAGVRQVKYSVDDVVLRSASGEWSPIVFLNDAAEIVGMGCLGAGELNDLRAQTSLTVPDVTLTVPEIDWMTLVSVKANGEEIQPREDGTYAIPQGAFVAVTFAPADGAFLDNPTMVFQMNESMELPESGRPQVIPPSEILVINEIMASNGTTLLTAARQPGLDWIEIHNKSDADVDITGWYLSDNPTKAQSKWAKVEGNGVIPAHGYKIVWADSNYLGFTAGEAYTRIGLSSDGETVFLATPGGEMVHSVKFGQQIKDVSIGVGNHAQTLVAADGAAEWRVGEGAWTPCTGTIGTSAATGAGFTVVTCAMKEAAAEADDVPLQLADPSCWAEGAAPTTNVYAALTSANGLAAEHAVLVAEGTVNLAQAGLWSFHCGGEGASTLVISRGDMSWKMDYPSISSTFSFPAAGAYDIKLICRARDGAAAPELLVGAGELDPEEDADSYVPLGSDDSFTHTGVFAANLATNILDAVNGAGSFDWRATFTLDAVPAPADTVQMNLRYADGFVARLNGVKFAEAPAAAARAKDEALAAVTLDVPADLFTTGANVLKITVLNSDPDDSEMLVSADLRWSKAGGDMAYYFPKATPGRANGVDAKDGPTPKVVFSEPHGYKTAPFQLELSCPDEPDAAIYYTLDGTSPSTRKTRYTGPITVSRTTVVRAAVPDAEAILQNDTSASYFFLDDILTQSGVPAGFPASGAVNGQVFRYGMSAGIVQNSTWRNRLLDGFTNSIATVSIVIDPANLFNASTGIYVNASNGGRTWERQTLVEMFSPTNAAAEFTVPCGIRIRGAYSRGSGYPKHSFRLFFRNEYGAGKLKFPLFGSEGAKEFDKMDFRTAQNYSWANGSDKFTFIEECFSRDSQRDLGQSYHRSRYYNLFINGTYWGVYQTEERTSGDFGATYFGGSDEDYDVVRTSQPGYVTGIVEGEDKGWRDFWNISVNQGYGSSYPDNYNRVRGLDPDGTPNPLLPIYLDPTNVCAYMMTSHFASDSDSPATSGSDTANNNAQLWNRYNGTNTLGGISQKGWVYHRHDAEHSLSTNESYDRDSLTRGTELANANMKLYNNFNPAELHYKLLANAEYKTLVADMMFRHCVKEGGAMTGAEGEKRFRSRMAELDDAVVCESARWGYARNQSFTRDQWLNACDRCLEFINRRPAYLVQFYRNHGWYPALDPARAVSGLGEHVLDGAVFGQDERVYLAEGGVGTVYYTTDGSDPRREGGAVNASAQVYTGGLPAITYVNVVEKGDAWDCFDWGGAPADDAAGNTWRAPAYAADAQWRTLNALLGFPGTSSYPVSGTLYRYENHASSGTQTAAFYFRKKFTMPEGASSVTSLKLNVCYDDGYVMYINGTEVDRVNIAAGETYYGMYISGNYVNPEWTERTVSIPAGLLQTGENVVAVELHQCHGTSSDAYWGVEISYPKAPDATGGIEVPPEGLTLKARVLSANGEWSALEEVKLVGTSPADPLADSVRFHSFMGIPPLPSDGDTDEWITLTNLSATTSYDLTGLKIVVLKNGDKIGKAKCAFTLDGVALAAGGSVTLRQADYLTAGWTKITNGDVLLYLFDRDGSTEIQTSAVNQKLFPTVVAGDTGPGGGASLVATAFGATTGPEDWKASFSPVEGYLRFESFCGITTGTKGDVDEWIVLTNLSPYVTLDLAGSQVVIAKEGTELAAASCVVNFTDQTVAPGGSIRLEQAAYGWSKITNNKLEMYLFDATGATAQTSRVTQKNFPLVYGDAGGPGGGGYLYATTFGAELVSTDWEEAMPQPALPTDEAGNPVGTVAGTVATVDVAKAGAGMRINIPAGVTEVRMSVNDGGGTAVDATGYYKAASLVPVDGTIVPELDPEVVRPVFAASGVADAVVVAGETIALTVRVKPGLHYTLQTAAAIDGAYADVAGCKKQAAADADYLTFTVTRDAATSAFYKAVVTDR